MPTNRLTPILEARVDELRTSGRLKGAEAVTLGILPPANGKGPRFLIEGGGERGYLRMNSNSYLGLSLNARVLAAEEEAVRRYGTGPGAVRFISGTWAPHVALERRLAKFHGREAGMLFSSAYATVMGVLPQLITDKTAVISDALNHSCIINAIALARPAEKRIYRHLDLDELERHLAAVAKTCTRAIVVTDGVFSMRGDHAPLDAIAKAHRRVRRALSGKHHSGGGRLPRRRRLRPHRPRHRGGHGQPPGRRAHRHSGQGLRRQRRLRRGEQRHRRLPARDLALLHLFKPDHAGRGGGRARRGRSRRRPGGPRRARSPALDDGGLPQRA